MESQSYQQQQPEENNGPVGVAGSGGASKSTFLCRQSSSRWIPTTDQIRILRDLYYNCGVRSPSAEQIQRISARLRQYGKIEGKNVFYWFQNHKARERQKKRLTVDIASNKYNTGMLSPAAVCAPPGVYCVGQVGGNACGGSVLVEKNYMEYSLAGALGGGGGGSMMEGNTGWIGVEPASVPSLYYHHQRQAYLYEHQQHQYYPSGIPQRNGGEEEEGEEAPPVPPHIETLPLFPVHSRPHQDARGEDHEGGSREWVVKAHASLSGHFPATLYLDHPQDPDQLQRREEGGRRRNHRVYDGDSSINIGGASLELSLYSYGSPPHGPN